MKIHRQRFRVLDLDATRKLMSCFLLGTLNSGMLLVLIFHPNLVISTSRLRQRGPMRKRRMIPSLRRFEHFMK
ncbi:hypothetical protein C464_17407 [Halorubrum coriense DSM 10284]|uniref:Uncharacterized protein n=1 Tax=Halorubrum coriense DSM 10284 TaxID=1227466 RepID=M0E4F4_9EURY|nr:hypothetical protein C464_17407 [Halorubrum coriense DSM 10284]